MSLWCTSIIIRVLIFLLIRPFGSSVSRSVLTSRINSRRFLDNLCASLFKAYLSPSFTFRNTSSTLHVHQILVADRVDMPIVCSSHLNLSIFAYSYKPYLVRTLRVFLISLSTAPIQDSTAPSVFTGSPNIKLSPSSDIIPLTSLLFSNINYLQLSNSFIRWGVMVLGSADPKIDNKSSSEIK